MSNPQLNDSNGYDADEKNTVTQVVCDTDFTLAIAKTYRIVKITWFLLLPILLLTIAFGFYAVEAGKAKGYIVIRDATGKLTQIITDEIDVINSPELHFFVADFAEKFYSWDYATTYSEEHLVAKYANLQRFFDPDFFKIMISLMQKIFIPSLQSERVITRLGNVDITYQQIDKSEASVSLVVHVHIFKAGVDTVSGYETHRKSVNMKIKRGDRQQNNLYGMYIYSYDEIKTERLQSQSQQGR